MIFYRHAYKYADASKRYVDYCEKFAIFLENVMSPLCYTPNITTWILFLSRLNTDLKFGLDNRYFNSTDKDMMHPFEGQREQRMEKWYAA